MWRVAPSQGATFHKWWEDTFTQRRHGLEEGKIWTLFTPSVSHQDWAHLSGNMVLFLYLGKRLHELLGRARFLALYFASAAAGSLATELAYRNAWLPSNADSVFRYVNILNGDAPDEVMSLGASDAVMGMLVFFYLAFPRAQIHVFRGWALLERAWPSNPVAKRLGKVSVNAMWMLPVYFLGDFGHIYQIRHAKERRLAREQARDRENWRRGEPEGPGSGPALPKSHLETDMPVDFLRNTFFRCERAALHTATPRIPGSSFLRSALAIP